MRYRWTTAQRPSNPPVGTSGFNTTLGYPEAWTGATWLALSGGAGFTPEVAHFFDNAGGAAVALPILNATMGNTHPLNYSLPGGGHVNIATPGTYLVRYSLGFVGQAPNAVSNYMARLDTSPPGLGLWAALVGSDAWCERVNIAGRLGSMTGEGFITVPVGGLDVRISGGVVFGSPAITQANGTRMILERVA